MFGPVPVAPQQQLPYDVDGTGLLRDDERLPGLGRRLLGDDGGGVPGGVGPVHLQADQQLQQRGPQRPGGPVAQRGLRGGGAQPDHDPGQPVHLGDQLVREHLVRRPPYRRLPLAAAVGLRGREPPVLAQEFTDPRRVREQPVDLPEGVVAGGARDGPGRRQVLPVREDLLHDRPAAPGGLVQPREVVVGVGEPVGVVDAQPVDDALAQQLEHLRVRGVEDFRVLDAHPDQLRNAEETPVVELRAGQSPPHGAVPLRVQEPRQRQLSGALTQREDVVVVAQHVTVDRHVLQLPADGTAEHRQQHLPALGLPVDVEPARVRRLRALPEDLPQGVVVARGHRHVVRHDVHHEAEAVLPGGAREGPQSVLAAEFVPHARVVDDVVAVRGARDGLEDGGQMQMRDAERRQVRHGRSCRRERELGLQLQPVGGRGHCRVGSLRCHADLRTRPAVFRVIDPASGALIGRPAS